MGKRKAPWKRSTPDRSDRLVFPGRIGVESIPGANLGKLKVLSCHFFLSAKRAKLIAVFAGGRLECHENRYSFV
ncbi:MAG: hypothetical protein D6722_04020 [Bacteroidetes bacterium]|nr:MAG: hypothetical protein D6722_04020 [Bacteroidota bacterium]